MPRNPKPKPKRYCRACIRELGKEEKFMDYCITCAHDHHMKTFPLRLHPEYSNHAEEKANRYGDKTHSRMQREARIALAWADVVPELSDDEWTGFLAELFGSVV